VATYRTKRCQLDPEYRKRVNEQAREYRKQRYSSDPDFKSRTLEHNTKARDRIRKELDEYRKTLTCSRCGTSDWRVLQFHHRDPSVKTRNVAAFQSRKGLEREIAKCDVLCANCHLIVHYEQKLVNK
jgi:hypothetical protein